MCKHILLMMLLRNYAYFDTINVKHNLMTFIYQFSVHMCTHIFIVTLLRSNTYIGAIYCPEDWKPVGNIKNASMCLCCLFFSYKITCFGTFK